MKLPSLLLFGVLFAPTLSAANAPFEGTVNATMQVRGQTIPAEYTIKGHKVRIDVQLMQHTSSVIADLDAQTQTVLLPQLQAYAVHHGEAPSHLPQEAIPKITDLNRTETIAGHTCEDYSLDSVKYSGTLCIAKDIGGGALGPEIAGALGSSIRGLQAIKNPGMPLRLELKAKDSDAAGQDMTMIVTQVVPATISDTQFTVPAGWREMPGLLPSGH